MGHYLRPNCIRDAINRLVASRARAGFTDFLILKRALARAQSGTVPFSSTDPDFTAAIRELAATATGGNASTGVPAPFVKVFGTADTDKYVSRKMLTNGPADTLSGPGWRDVVRIVGSRPRRGGLTSGYENGLANLILKASGKKPNLLDAAIWFHRGVDLELLSNNGSTDANTLSQSLQADFIKALGLTTREVSDLFEPSPATPIGQPAETLVQDSPAEPTDYLPDLSTAVGGESDADLAETANSFVVAATARDVGLRVADGLALNFVASLLAKRFLILTGLAGSGKTKLAQAFARWITPLDSECVTVVPVGADWTGNENILGYPDGLRAPKLRADGSVEEPGAYLSKPALALIQRALTPGNEQTPHFLILDEMNLSHVERYFADILSAIESGEPIPLHEDAERKADGRDVPRQLSLPDNLFIIGTVNVDETTYMFSPKVLDRANVIEFRLEAGEVATFLKTPVKPRLDLLAGKGESFGKAFVDAASNPDATTPGAVEKQYAAEMLLFFTVLREQGAEFGYRVAHEAARFLHFYQQLGGFAADDKSWFNAAMDAVIIQKLLPKLHGSRSKLEGLLWALAWACGPERKERDGRKFPEQLADATLAQDEATFGPEAAVKSLANSAPLYPMSFDKVMRMWRKLVRDQFVTFAEA